MLKLLYQQSLHESIALVVPIAAVETLLLGHDACQRLVPGSECVRIRCELNLRLEVLRTPRMIYRLSEQSRCLPPLFESHGILPDSRTVFCVISKAIQKCNPQATPCLGLISNYECKQYLSLCSTVGEGAGSLQRSTVKVGHVLNTRCAGHINLVARKWDVLCATVNAWKRKKDEAR